MSVVNSTSRQHAIKLNILYLNKIPPIQNTALNLQGHFSQFGTVSDVKVAFNKDPGAAAIIFKSQESAEAALKSQKMVFNNSQIKVSQHRPLSVSTSASISPSDQTEIGWQCTICNKLIATESSLKRHIKQLHAEVKCSICQSDFISFETFRKHYNAKHLQANKSIGNGGQIGAAIQINMPTASGVKIALCEAQSISSPGSALPTESSVPLTTTPNTTKTATASKSKGMKFNSSTHEQSLVDRIHKKYKETQIAKTLTKNLFENRESGRIRPEQNTDTIPMKKQHFIALIREKNEFKKMVKHLTEDNKDKADELVKARQTIPVLKVLIKEKDDLLMKEKQKFAERDHKVANLFGQLKERDGLLHKKDHETGALKLEVDHLKSIIHGLAK